MTQHDEVNKPPAPKKLTKIPEGKMVGGVCTGLADYLSIDVTVVRLGVAVVSLITGGAGIIAYIVGMIVIPERGAEGSVPPPPAALRTAALRTAALRTAALRTAALRTAALGTGGLTARGLRTTWPAGLMPCRPRCCNPYSHSIVAGGLLVMSSTTRFTSRTSLVMRVLIRSSTS